MNQPWIRSALFAAAAVAGVAQAQTVTPPPLPPGSNLVRVEPGLNEEERKRHVRAHHHKAHHGKDVTRDDSVHGPIPSVVRVQSQPAAGSSGAAAGSAAPGRNPGGAGTGPAREKTDRGAGSWFFGPDTKK